MLSNEQAGVANALRESWFWAGVFRDHATFIHDNLAPQQEQQARWAQNFQRSFEQLHAEAQQVAQAAGIAGPAGHYAVAGAPAEAPLGGLQGQELLRYEQQARRLAGSALEILGSLKAFKEDLLQAKLDGKIKLGLAPTLIQHMINEAEEAQRQLGPSRSVAQLPPAMQVLHYHLHWLPDAAGHAATLHGSLDGTETQLLERTHEFKQVFNGMHLKALDLYSMLRAAPRMAGALKRFNRESMAQITTFRSFLTELREHLENSEVLTVALVPQMADHMLREALYYTEKIMAVEGAI